jgi:hypothetical protein
MKSFGFRGKKNVRLMVCKSRTARINSLKLQLRRGSISSGTLRWALRFRCRRSNHTTTQFFSPMAPRRTRNWAFREKRS